MNGASTIVVGILIAFVGFAVWRNFRKGAPCSCGCSCGECAGNGGCHCHEKENEEKLTEPIAAKNPL